jgi:hypothetical protein
MGGILAGQKNEFPQISGQHFLMAKMGEILVRFDGMGMGNAIWAFWLCEGRQRKAKWMEKNGQNKWTPFPFYFGGAPAPLKMGAGGHIGQYNPNWGRKRGKWYWKKHKVGSHFPPQKKCKGWSAGSGSGPNATQVLFVCASQPYSNYSLLSFKFIYQFLAIQSTEYFSIIVNELKYPINSA